MLSVLWNCCCELVSGTPHNHMLLYPAMPPAQHTERFLRNLGKHGHHQAWQAEQRKGRGLCWDPMHQHQSLTLCASVPAWEDEINLGSKGCYVGGGDPCPFPKQPQILTGGAEAAPKSTCYLQRMPEVLVRDKAPKFPSELHTMVLLIHGRLRPAAPFLHTQKKTFYN